MVKREKLLPKYITKPVRNVFLYFWAAASSVSVYHQGLTLTKEVVLIMKYHSAWLSSSGPL